MSEGYKSTDAGTIPIEWEVKRVGDFAVVTAGGTPSTSVREFWGGDIPWMNSGEINLRRVKSVEGRITEEGLKNSSTKIIPKHSVLIALAGQGKTRGKVAVNEIELCTNQSLAVIMNLSGVNYEFLFQNLESRYTELRKMSTGEGGRGGLNLSIIKSVLVALPSFAEQQKIAEILSTVDEKIDVIDAQITQTQELKKGLMQRLLTKGIGHTTFKESPLGEIPETWDVVSLEKIFKLSSGQGLSSSQAIEGKHPVYGGNGISFYHSDYTHSDPQIIIGRVGVYCGCVHKTSPNCWITDNALFIKEKLNDYVDNYLFYLLVKLDLNTFANKNAQPVISGQKIYPIQVAYPPKGEQQKIALILSTVDEKLEVLREKKSGYQELKKGLMQQLLPGKMRVNHLIENEVFA